MKVDYTRKWYVMLAVGLSVLLATIDISIVNVALPTLERELNTTFSVVQWVILAYTLTLATLTLGVGRLGDIVGKKPIFTVGFAFFTVASVLCGLAPSVELLIAFRVLQAIGGTMVLALGTGIVTEGFPARERGKAMGVIGTVVSVGIVLGPTLGGILIQQLSWRWIFFVNVPVGIVGILAAIRYVPAIKPPGGQRFDWLGAGLMFTSLLTLSLGLSLGQGQGFDDLTILSLLAVALITFIAFVAVERRVAEPMVDLTMFRLRVLRINLGTGFLTFFAVAGLFILMPFYLNNVLGYDVQQTGLLLASTSILIGLISPLSGWLSDRVGVRPMTVIGLTVLTLGYLGAANLGTSTRALGYILLIGPIGIGMAIFQSPNNSGVMGAATPERLGITSGMLTLTRIIGQLVGLVVIGTMWSLRVGARAGLDGPPTGASGEAQVGGLNDVMLLTAAVIGVALIVTVRDLVKHGRFSTVTKADVEY